MAGGVYVSIACRLSDGISLLGEIVTVNIPDGIKDSFPLPKVNHNGLPSEARYAI